MKYRIFTYALAIIAYALPSASSELENPERQPRLKIEIEPAQRCKKMSTSIFKSSRQPRGAMRNRLGTKRIRLANYKLVR